MDTSLYKLNRNAAEVLSEAEETMMAVTSDAIDKVHSPKQPVLYSQLIKIFCVYDQLMYHLVFSEDGSEVTEIRGEDVSVINKLLARLKELF